MGGNDRERPRVLCGAIMFDLCHCQWELWFNPYGYRASWWKRNKDKSWLTITATLKQVSIVTGLKLYNKLGCHTRQITPWRGPFLKAFGFLCSLKIKMQASYFQLILVVLSFFKHSLFSWSQIIWEINMFAQEMYKQLSPFQPLFPLRGQNEIMATGIFLPYHSFDKIMFNFLI